MSSSLAISALAPKIQHGRSRSKVRAKFIVADRVRDSLSLTVIRQMRDGFGTPRTARPNFGKVPPGRINWSSPENFLAYILSVSDNFSVLFSWEYTAYQWALHRYAKPTAKRSWPKRGRS